MVISCDTSFLFALYGNDAHSPRAVAWVSKRNKPLTISPFNIFELANALRFAEFRKILPPGSAARNLAQFEAALAQERLVVATCNLAVALEEARRLSATHTLAHGHRSFDILQVAAALTMGAKIFLTFDGNQKKLAQAEGLQTPL